MDTSYFALRLTYVVSDLVTSLLLRGGALLELSDAREGILLLGVRVPLLLLGVLLELRDVLEHRELLLHRRLLLLELPPLCPVRTAPT